MKHRYHLIFGRTKKRGETIVEILVAMAVLTLIITSVYSVLLRASKTNTSVKNRVIALNIARDGLEGVRNIRDTNWLKFSGDRRNKWLCRPGYTKFQPSSQQSPENPKVPYDFLEKIENRSFFPENFNQPSVQDSWIDSCIAHPIEDGYYILERVSYLDASGAEQMDPVRFVLEPKLDNAVNEGTILANRDEFRLYYFEDTSGQQHHYTHAKGRFTEELCSGGFCPLKPFTPSPFYRKIKIDVVSAFEDPDGGIDLDDAAGNPTLCEGNCTRAKLKVTSMVEWQEEDQWESLTLETHLFDFYERTDY